MIDTFLVGDEVVGAHMRTGRTTTADLLRQGRRALALAGGLSVLAAALGLVLPLFAWHAVDAALRRAPLDALVPLGVLVMGILAIRLVLLEARDRTLLRTGLWLHQTAGRAILREGLGREGARNGLLADHAALAQLAHAATSRRAGSRMDWLCLVMPLVLMVAIQPLLGLIGFAAAGVGLVMIRHAGRLSSRALAGIGQSETAAGDSWRLMAHNASMLASRGLADGMQHDWGGLNASALSQRYRLSLALLRSRRTVCGATMIGNLAVVGVGASLVLADALTAGGLAAAMLIMATTSGHLLAAHDATLEQAAAERALHQLAAPARVDSAAPGHVTAGPFTHNANVAPYSAAGAVA